MFKPTSRKVLNIEYEFPDEYSRTCSFDTTKEEIDSFRQLFSEIKQKKGFFIPKDSYFFNPRNGDVSAEDLYIPLVGKETLYNFMKRFRYLDEYPPYTITSIWVSETIDVESIF